MEQSKAYNKTETRISMYKRDMTKDWYHEKGKHESESKDEREGVQSNNE